VAQGATRRAYAGTALTSATTLASLIAQTISARTSLSRVILDGAAAVLKSDYRPPWVSHAR
jgi:hypothetical protein